MRAVLVVVSVGMWIMYSWASESVLKGKVVINLPTLSTGECVVTIQSNSN